MEKTSTLIMEKKARLELLEAMFNTLENEENYIRMRTEWYDTDEPRKNEDGSIKTRDDGSVIYKQTYRDVPRDEATFTPEDKAKLTAIETIKNQLEKMI